MNVSSASMNNSFITEEEIYLFNIGKLYHSYLKFGSHVIEWNNTLGTFFVVWAPNAQRVSVVGDFNEWSGLNHQMKCRGESGVWTLFIPGLVEGTVYKYEITTSSGRVIFKSDPFANFSELRPSTASVVYSLDNFLWNDQEWLEERKKSNHKEKPLLIYEVHLGSWRRTQEDSFISYKELSTELIPYVLKMGYTYIELLPIMEHPFDGSWGYQLTGYYACTSRYGDPFELMGFINECHQKGLGVILDWVPGHFCKDAHGLGDFDGTALYEDEVHEQWGTYKFNFYRTEVWSFLISNAIFWFDKYHVDGLRVDGVSSMLYLDYGKEGHAFKSNIFGGRENLRTVEFLKSLNETVFKYYSDVLMIAEEATDWPLVSWPTYLKGLGFNYKWNMGWMNDTLRYMELDFSERSSNHHLLTFSLMYAFSENFILPLSHDEVVHGKKSLLNKMPGDYFQKFAGLRSLYTYFICHPGKKLIFMGSELAQFIEWRYDQELDWLLLDYEMHQKYQRFTADLNRLYLKEKVLWQNDHDWSGFTWVDVDNYEQSILVFLRHANNTEDFLVIVINFGPTTYRKYRIGVPFRTSYKEIFNSDRAIYGGADNLNPKDIIASPIPWHNQPYSIDFLLPPIAAVIFKPQPHSNSNTRIFTERDSGIAQRRAMNVSRQRKF